MADSRAGPSTGAWPDARTAGTTITRPTDCERSSTDSTDSRLLVRPPRKSLTPHDTLAARASRIDSILQEATRWRALAAGGRPPAGARPDQSRPLRGPANPRA